MTTIIPKVDKVFNDMEVLLQESEQKVQLIENTINTAGSNADIFLNSVWNSSNVTGMYNYIKQNSNVLQVLE